MAALVALLIVALIAWSLLPQSDDRGVATATLPAATETPEPRSRTAPPTPSPPRGHRLAGTVVGDVRYAVIEDSHGENELYRPGQRVPGLGKLMKVEARRAVFEGDNGQFELPLAKAPTPTPETELDIELNELEEEELESDPSALESSPSDEPDLPAF
jgi:hypothetical protein